MKLERDLVKITNSFKIIKNFVPKSEKQKLCFAYVHSKIKYGIQVYGTAAKSHIMRLQKLQNKAVKVLYSLDIRMPTK